MVLGRLIYFQTYVETKVQWLVCRPAAAQLGRRGVVGYRVGLLFRWVWVGAAQLEC